METILKSAYVATHLIFSEVICRREILPLRKTAPTYMDEKALPDFGDSKSAVSLDRVEIVTRYQIQFKGQ